MPHWSIEEDDNTGEWVLLDTDGAEIERERGGDADFKNFLEMAYDKFAKLSTVEGFALIQITNFDDEGTVWNLRDSYDFG